MSHGRQAFLITYLWELVIIEFLLAIFIRWIKQGYNING